MVLFMEIIISLAIISIIIGVILNILTFFKKRKNKNICEERQFDGHIYSEQIDDEEPKKEEIKEVKKKDVNKRDNKKIEILKINSNYQLPPLNLLDIHKKTRKIDNSKIEKNIAKIEEILRAFKVKAKIIGVHVGTYLIQYEVELTQGEKISKLTSISREIALALAEKNVRIQAPIPGKSTCGIEVFYEMPHVVCYKNTINKVPKNIVDKQLYIPLGEDFYGNTHFFELNKASHTLIAGSTGSGKSVFIKSIITNILMNAKPYEVKLVLIDTWRLELNAYNGIPHLLMPVITDSKKAITALEIMLKEIKNRFHELSEKNALNIEEYNKFIDRENMNKSDKDKLIKMPYIIVIVDEIYDIAKDYKDELTNTLIDIIKNSKNVGVHLIISTQLPNTSIIPTIVKTNLPTRISFYLPTVSDSRTILGIEGAEKLFGRGDMLYLAPKSIKPMRMQGVFISDEEIKKINEYIINQQRAQFEEEYTNLDINTRRNTSEEEYDDPLYDEIVEFVITSGKASASLLQRRFKLNYNRAARLIDILEERGIIGPQNGSKPREVLVAMERNEDY